MVGRYQQRGWAKFALPALAVALCVLAGLWWWLRSGRERLTITAHGGQVLAIALSRNGELLATAGQDGAPDIDQ